MTAPKSEKIWHNGQFVDWEKANVHVSSHGLHYGSSWFEGLRCYKSSRGSEVFRLGEHVERLFDSCKIYRREIPFSPQDLQQAILETIRVNELEHCYIQPPHLLPALAAWGSILCKLLRNVSFWCGSGEPIWGMKRQKPVPMCVSRAGPEPRPTLFPPWPR